MSLKIPTQYAKMVAYAHALTGNYPDAYLLLCATQEIARQRLLTEGGQEGAELVRQADGAASRCREDFIWAGVQKAALLEQGSTLVQFCLDAPKDPDLNPDKCDHDYCVLGEEPQCTQCGLVMPYESAPCIVCGMVDCPSLDEGSTPQDCPEYTDG